MSRVVHHFDDAMAYTACKLLHNEVDHSANREDVTCPRCLASEDAEGCRWQTQAPTVRQDSSGQDPGRLHLGGARPGREELR